MRKPALVLVGLLTLLFCQIPVQAQTPDPARKAPAARKADAKAPAARKADAKAPAARKADAKAPAARKADAKAPAARKAPDARKAAAKAPPAPKAAPKQAAKPAAKHKKNIIIRAFEAFVGYLATAVFYPIFGFPFVVIILVLGAIFFTVRMNFINLRGFAHAINIIRGKYDDPNDEGEISHFQALTSALSATVGLGNIAGVAVAVGVGGAGAVFWMILIAFFGMTAKFVECSLAQMWRKVDAQGTVNGGPMYYLSKGLEERGLGGIGKFFGAFFAVCIIGGAFGGGNMFQANQSYELVSAYLPATLKASKVAGFNLSALLFGIVLAVLVGLVILGGIKRIGAATSKIVPFMVTIYIGASIFIILTNAGRVPAMMSSIFTSAFGPEAVFGGILGVMIQGIKRAVFSNEAGIGSAAIAHSAAKTKEPIREGMVAMVGPFIDTIVICLMTATVLLLTAPENKSLTTMRAAQKNVYQATLTLKAAKTDAAKKIAKAKLAAAKKVYKGSQKGAQITSDAFGSVFSWFPLVLSIVVFLFAYSTMISWSYYGEQGWIYLFGAGTIKIYRLIFLGFVVLGSVTKLGAVLDFSDIMIFLCAFPNIIGGVILSGHVKDRLDDYWTRFQKGEFKEYK